MKNDGKEKEQHGNADSNTEGTAGKGTHAVSFVCIDGRRNAGGCADHWNQQQYVPFGFENIGVISVQDSEDVIESTENGIAGDLGVLGMAACAARRWKS